MNCIPESIPLVFACINCWINKISLAPRTYANCQTSLTIMLACFLYCFFVLVVWVLLRLHLSLLVDSSLVVAPRATSDIRASQVHPGIVYRFQGASVAVWWRSCVDLGVALGLFVGSVSISKQRLYCLRNQFEGVNSFGNSFRVSR